MIYNEAERTIAADRLLLRPFRETDVDRVAELCSSSELHKGVLYLPWPYTVECARVWIEGHADNFSAERSYEFAVTDRETGCLYGCIGLFHHPRHKNAEMGYWMGEEYWGNGYATEAARAVIEFAFRCKGLHRVYAHHLVTNPASGRVMQKCGMVCEGTMKEHVLKNGRYIDLVCYGLLNPAG